MKKNNITISKVLLYIVAFMWIVIGLNEIITALKSKDIYTALIGLIVIILPFIVYFIVKEKSKAKIDEFEQIESSSGTNNYTYSESTNKNGHPVLTILLLVFLWPIGLITMWATGTFNKKVRIIVTVAFVGVFVMAISLSNEKVADNSSVNLVQQQEEMTEVTTESISSVDFGTSGSISDGLSLAVNSVTESDNIPAASGLLSYKPDSGKYAIVNVTIKNVSKSSKRLLLNYFKLIDAEGASYVATIIPMADEKFITVDTINPNLDITGNLVFEIPKSASASDFLLQYSDFNIFSGVTKFNLK